MYHVQRRVRDRCKWIDWTAKEWSISSVMVSLVFWRNNGSKCSRFEYRVVATIGYGMGVTVVSQEGVR